MTCTIHPNGPSISPHGKRTPPRQWIGLVRAHPTDAKSDWDLGNSEDVSTTRALGHVSLAIPERFMAEPLPSESVAAMCGCACDGVCVGDACQVAFKLMPGPKIS